MKKYLLGIVAIFMAIVFSAFSETNDKVDDGNLQTYTWHKYNTAGDSELDPIVSYSGTADAARTQFACPTSGAVICGRAYTSGGSPLNIYIMKPAP